MSIRGSRLLAALLVALLPAAAIAQSGTGTITGLVRDTSGAPIPGATIQVTSEEGGRTTETFSGEAGTYSVSGLAPGRYRVEARLDGFDLVMLRVTVVAEQLAPVNFTLAVARFGENVIVTARRVEEVAQEVPIPLAVIDGGQMESAGNFNVQRVQQAVPTVQFFTTNPRNSFLNIRGLGLPFGLANDGIETGVGLYVDGVFYARPAAATMDFIDVERLEVLRGPQGTLFGKNTTAGALNLTTRAPNFNRSEGLFDFGVGNYGFLQARGSVTGPLGRKVAGRLSFSFTGRDGLLQNVATGEGVNTLNNQGVRGQVRVLPRDGLVLTFAGDYTRQRPNGYAPVVVGYAPNLTNANRQFPAVAADLGYTLPSTNPFDRLIDTNTPWQSNQDFGGASVSADWRIGRGQLTSITAWRFWDWGPSNDRDFTGLNVTELSQAPSDHDQYTQEVRYAARVHPRLDFVTGVFVFYQTLTSRITEDFGSDAWRWNLNPTAPGVQTPGLLDGYGATSFVDFDTTSAAVYGQFQWQVTDRFRILPGLRFNYDRKAGTFDRVVYGGLETTDPALLAHKTLTPHFYDTDAADNNVSGQLTLGYAFTDRVNAYATYATSFKSIGFNLAALPTVGGQPDLSLAVVAPEDVRHYEFGLKTTPWPGVTANLNFFNTDVHDYQTTVRDPSPNIVRGYLANADLVRVRGVEFDGNARVGNRFQLHTAIAYTDGTHASFPNAPIAFELTGGAASRQDISGSLLPGLPKWAVSVGGDYAHPVAQDRAIVVGVDTSYRSSYSSSTTPSSYLVVDGYGVVNARVGYQWANRWTLSFWARNVLDNDYIEQLAAVAGNAGLYVGFLGEPRTYGVTLRTSFGSRN